MSDSRGLQFAFYSARIYLLIDFVNGRRSMFGRLDAMKSIQGTFQTFDGAGIYPTTTLCYLFFEKTTFCKRHGKKITNNQFVEHMKPIIL